MARILIAEDSPTQAERLIFALEERGFEVFSAADGAQALALFGANTFDLVISDVIMPVMTGYELCRAIKSGAAEKHVPVILLTSLSEPMDVIHGLESGADHFLRKPFRIDDLIACVDRILANVRRRNPDRMSLGIQVNFLGSTFTITSEKEQILDLLISTFEETIRANRELKQSKTELAAANAKIKLYTTELEDRVRERTAALAAANHGLQAEIEAREQAEKQLIHAQRMEAIGNLTGGMAHDFNNMLGVVIGNLDLLRSVVEPIAAADELVADALSAALRGAELTRRLLAFARRQPLNPEQLNVNELVASIIELLGRVLGEGIETVLELGDEVWPIVADPAQLEASLTNLATNARDAMPNGGRLRFATRNQYLDADYAGEHHDVIPGEYAVIEVSDTGTGMPAAVASRIFEPFFTTKGSGKGTGLGLAMVFGFMKQSHGHINVYSEEGVGTVFRLFLPRNVGAVETKPAVAPPLVHGHGETVLVVEDNPAMRHVVMLQLRALDYHVLEADTATHGLDILARERVDMVFSDIVMPGAMNGIELARAALARWPDLRVMLTSGFADTVLLEELGTMRNIRVLSKPYRRDELGRAMREALGARVKENSMHAGAGAQT